MIGIADDVIIHGNDGQEHNRCLHKLIEVAHEYGLMFNGRKNAVKQPSVTFFGCICDKDQTQPDPAKVSTEHNMASPEAPTQLQKFLSMGTYLSLFMATLSLFTTLLHVLLKKSKEFTWNESYQEAIDTVKCLVCTDTTLWYFCIYKPITIWVDAS